MKKVSIVILNWNCKEFLPRCIESVLNQTYKNIGLIIMDNNSTDGSVDMLKKRYPSLNIMVNSENLGFAKAHNIGVSNTNGDYYLPLNPDVELTPNYIEEMVKAIEIDEMVGRVSGKIFLKSKNNNNIIYTTGHFIKKNGIVGNRGYGKLDEGQFSEIEEVFGVNGAAPLYKREMFEDIRLGEKEYFDELFFVYGDDIDLDWRAQLRGWKCLFTPYAVGYHEVTGSQGIKDFQIQVEYIKNKYIMCFKNAFALELFLSMLPRIITEMFVMVYRFDRKSYWIIEGIIRRIPAILRKRRKTLNRMRVNKRDIRRWFQ
jgi:GT2 family glycosyltransferase